MRYLFERVGIDAPDESEWPGSLLGFTGSKQTRSTKKRAAMWM